MAQTNWEADKMWVCFILSYFIWSDIWWFEPLVLCCITRLDVYIYDYLVKRNLQTSAKAFQAEGKVSLDPVGKRCALYFIATIAFWHVCSSKFFKASLLICFFICITKSFILFVVCALNIVKYLHFVCFPIKHCPKH